MRVDAMTTAVAVASLAASGLVPQAPVAPPAPRTPAEMLRREAIDGSIERAWRGLDGHRATPEEEAAIDEIAGEFGNTYGEVVAGGARTVFDMLGLLHDAPADAAFADLGSGAGRMVAQCWLECKVQSSTGVELSRTRHDCAVEGLARLLVDDDAPAALSIAAAPEFVHGDILAALPELEVSHAYVASLLFDDCMLAKLGRALDASTVASIATLSDFPSESFDRVGKRRAAMSWNAAGGGTDVFLYQRRRPTLFGKMFGNVT